MASPDVASQFLLSRSNISFDTFGAGARSGVRSLKNPPLLPSTLPGINISRPQEVGSLSVEQNCNRTLPVIDLAGLDSRDPIARKNIASQIGCATEEWGFFQVVNHSVPESVVSTMLYQSEKFFKMPLDLRKRAEIRGPNPRQRGYKGIFASAGDSIPIKEYLADYRSCGHAAQDIIAKIWPDGNRTFSNAIEEYCKAVEQLGCQLLELLAESLGVERSFFSQHFQNCEDCIGTWRLHHFPPNPAPATVLRTVPHSDPSLLTILKQDVKGLQVKKPGDSNWVEILPQPGAFVVNVGDILEAWSNGRFPSSEHRVVVHPEKERYAIVVFLDARPSLEIEAPPELIDDNHPARYVPFVAGDFRANFEKVKRRGDITRGKSLENYVRKPV